MKRALHDLSHEVPCTFNMGELIPVALYEGLPGDIIRGSSSMLVRTQPLLAPLMHKVGVSFYHFAVPNRIIMNDWEKFRTGVDGNNGEDTTLFPTITSPASTGWGIGTLADYLGIETGVPDLEVSALPFRAYAEIYNYFFRDKDLDTELTVSKASGPDTTTNTTLQMGSWEKDYFTSARPYPQKGSAISIPLSGDAPVVLANNTNYAEIRNASTRALTGSSALSSGTGGEFKLSGGVNTVLDPNDTLEADLSGVSAVDIEDLRVASAMQRFQELLARFGHTLPEFYRLFGVEPQDSRMQWPELIGSGYSPIQFSEVLQTAEGTDPVGELRGHGIAAAKSNRFTYHVKEDCIIMTVALVRPRTVYMNGINKLWNRRSRWDYFMPALQNLGQQAILNKEIYAGHSSPNGVFGYQDQYDEYRRIPSRVAGEFRDTLDFWTMARKFESEPALNSTFVKANPTNRVFATNADQLQVRVFNNIKAKRLVYKRSRPQLR